MRLRRATVGGSRSTRAGLRAGTTTVYGGGLDQIDLDGEIEALRHAVEEELTVAGARSSIPDERDADVARHAGRARRARLRSRLRHLLRSARRLVRKVVPYLAVVALSLLLGLLIVYLAAPG